MGGRMSRGNPPPFPLVATSSSLSHRQGKFTDTWESRSPPHTRICSSTLSAIRRGPLLGKLHHGLPFTLVSRNAFTLHVPSSSPPLFSNVVSPPPPSRKSLPPKLSSEPSSAKVIFRKRPPFQVWAFSQGKAFGPFRGGREDGGCQMCKPFLQQWLQGRWPSSSLPRPIYGRRSP
jgi:hypothetical protein